MQVARSESVEILSCGNYGGVRQKMLDEDCSSPGLRDREDQIRYFELCNLALQR